MGKLAILNELPITHYKEIGRIVMRWARIEDVFKKLTYSILDISPKDGRVAVREPKIEDLITNIEDLLANRKISVNVDWVMLKKNLKLLEGHRNNLAHNIWLKNPVHGGPPILQLLKGKWQPDPKKPSIKRRYIPEGEPVTLADLRYLSANMNLAVKTARAIAADVEDALKKQPQESSK